MSHVNYKRLSELGETWGDEVNDVELYVKSMLPQEALPKLSKLEIGLLMRCTRAMEAQSEAMCSMAKSMKWIQQRVEKWEKKHPQES